ncbi:TROVE domain-containing protein, partial [bacterium]
RVGLLAAGTPEARLVAERLTDVGRLKAARIHPVALLMALRTFATGYDERGDDHWYPAPEIVAALNEAFHLAFAAVEPSNKRFVVGVDVSGSMDSPVAGSRMTCAEGAAAMAMALVHAEPQVSTMAFANDFRSLPFHKGLRLDAALALTQGMTFGPTDCALPMRWARHVGVKADTFVVITDNETWSGPMKPMAELHRYREETGIHASLVVIGMTATEFTIADPKDPKTLDVAGFDATVPALVGTL